jgi:hypothetical protein
VTTPTGTAGAGWFVWALAGTESPVATSIVQARTRIAISCSWSVPRDQLAGRVGFDLDQGKAVDDEANSPAAALR